ncbi:hypothetical protein HELRODRAFT_150274, partial [Helobdella robusta]|uniref:Cadherin domain-containing protein n=1 Tax=Helobdella robusta TaxID=6412 RepID=T1EKE9_HELRO
YRIFTGKKLDREKTAQHRVVLFCWDYGYPASLNTSREIVIRVLDINDNIPNFLQSSYSADVEENNNEGSAVLKVSAVDIDEGPNAEITYSIEDDISNFDDVLSSFTLDQTTGTLYAKRHFDYETTKYFKFFVLATDNAQKIGGKPLSSKALVIINIQDANDESPKFSKDRYEFTISENAPMKTEVGVLQVTDADETAKFSRFNLTIESSFPPSSSSDGSGSGFFQLEPQTGVIWTTRTLDREQYAVHHLWLVARNTASPYLSGTAHVIVHVTDTNDNAPLIEYPSHDNYTVHVDCALEPGAPVARIRARDADLGENASLDYSVAKGNELGLIEVDGKRGLVSL